MNEFISVIGFLSLIGGFIIQYFIVAKYVKGQTEKQVEDSLATWWAKDNKSFELWAQKRHLEVLDKEINELYSQLWDKNKN